MDHTNKQITIITIIYNDYSSTQTIINGEKGIYDFTVQPDCPPIKRFIITNTVKE